MSILFLLIGAIVGGAVMQAFGGAVLGAAIGYLIGEVLDLNRRLRLAEIKLKRLDKSDQSDTHVPRVQGAPSPANVPFEPTPALASSVPSPGEAAVATATPPEVAREVAPQAMVATPAEQPAFEPRPRAMRTPVDGWDSKLGAAIKSYFTGGNLVVRVGIIVLFFGVAFLLKYAAERVQLPIEARLIGVAIGAIVLLALGWRLRHNRANYALMLQGAGIGVLYLTVFAALRLYYVLPAGGALLLLIGIGAFSAILAISQDSRALAIAGISGGFLAPILTSTGGGSHVLLFGYYALLNAGILAIAWFKAWRLLNLIGFAFTFVIGVLWGVNAYRPEHFASTEPFLILFLLFYVAIAVLYAMRQAPNLKGYLDGTLVFGTPLIAFGLQAAMVRHTPYALAYSALALAAFYLALAWVLFQRRRETLRMLVEAFLAIGVVFATLAIPLALDGRWTAATWALEGAGILWVGIRQQRVLARSFGLLLQLGAGLSFMSAAIHLTDGGMPILNSFYVGTVILSVAAWFSGSQLHRHESALTKPEQGLQVVLLGWGSLWWLGGGLYEIQRHVAFDLRSHASLVFVAASAILASLLSRHLQWPAARAVALVLPLTMVLFAIVELVVLPHPFAHLGFLAWPIAFAAHFALLKRHEADTPMRLLPWLHALGLWLLVLILTLEVGWAIHRLVQGQRVWPLIAWALVPIAFLVGLSMYGERLRWPLARHGFGYLAIGLAPVAAFLVLWLIYANFTSNGDPAPLPYAPLLNPLDIAQAMGFVALGLWIVRARRRDPVLFGRLPPKAIFGVAGALAFIALNGVLLRTLHHWAGVPFRLDAMLRSTLVQASFSIFWTVLALAAMFIATRKGWRMLWIVGAALMGVVVVKLFTIDIANVGGLARIVSFIGVAVLMLIVGYVSPVPPKTVEVKQ